MAEDKSTHEFDFVLAGGGLAGCVLAGRLSEALPHLKILLIEAGAESDESVYPALGYQLGTERTEWSYYSTTQKSGHGGESIRLLSGKVLGGSTAINVQTFTRGSSIDFDQWAEMVKDKGWCWDAMLPYFRKSETWYPSKEMQNDISAYEKFHGNDGPLKVSYVTSSGIPRNYPLRGKVEKFHQQLGHQRVGDINSGNPIGYGELPWTNYEGKRNFATFYPRGTNVTVWTDCFVERLITNGAKAEGVIVSRTVKNGGNEEVTRMNVFARKEVIVCAGAQSSPKILMLSGIGPADELKNHGITQVVDLPVGHNYFDHPSFPTYWTVEVPNASIGTGELQTPELNWLAGVPIEFMSSAPSNDLAKLEAKRVLPSEVAARYNAPGKSQIATVVLYASLDFTIGRNPIAIPPGKPMITVINVLFDPVSRGRILLRSNDPKDAPILDPALLESSVDRISLYEAVRASSDAIRKVDGLGAVEIKPDGVMQDDWSDEAIATRAKYAGTMLHPSGTCAMGSVVDTECRVIGVESLRVVDASVIPIPLGGHPQAPLYAFAERAADIIVKPLGELK